METQLLFRCFSDQSQGTNSPTLFAPAAALSAHEEVSAIQARHLNDALSWKKLEPSRFVFFTPSLLFAIAVASKKHYDGETNVRIVCFGVNKATDVHGCSVRLQLASTMCQQLGVEKRNKDGSVQDYTDVVVATTCVKPGLDARVAKFKELECSGLYTLYPSLEKNRFERRPRLNFVIMSNRGFGWTGVKPLSEAKVGLAARLAALFRRAGSNVKIESQIFAHLLAFQSRSSTDPALTTWLKKHTEDLILLDEDEMGAACPYVPSPIPEVAQYQALVKVLENKQFRHTGLSSPCAIASWLVQQEMGSFQAWELQRRAGYRADNPREEQKDSRNRHRKHERHGTLERFDRLPRRQYAHKIDKELGYEHRRPRFDARGFEEGDLGPSRYLGRRGGRRVRRCDRY